jgi:hypothetical protein
MEIQVFNTGLDALGNLLAPGAVDPHYALILSSDPTDPGSNAYILNTTLINMLGLSKDGVQNAYTTNGPNSDWIGPVTSETNSSPPGLYVYRTTFDLTRFDPDSATVTGRWDMDDYGISINLNGTPTGISAGDPTARNWQPFAITRGFVQGLNTLDFVVSNIVFTSYNPTALRVEISGTAALATNAPALSLDLQQLSSNLVQLSLSGKAGLDYQIFSSTNLLTWQPYTNVAGPTWTQVFSTLAEPARRKYFRAMTPP